MACLHPKTHRYKDALTGEWKTVLIPCGNCINCRHAFQDMWSIRLQESAKFYKQMIYDTLTIRPEAMPVKVDFTVPTKDGFLYGTTEKFRHWKVEAFKKKWSSFHRYFPRYSKDTYYLLKKTDFKVYEFPKSEFQKWMKRGRIAFEREQGYTPDIQYFLCQEYGPQTSRPHYHVLIFGLGYSQYMKYWGNPWKNDYGWTKPTYHFYTPYNQKDFQCIVRYCAKYCSKGIFDSPLVKDGLQSKPYRLISKGIGQGLLAEDYFKIFRDQKFTKWMEIHKPSEETYKLTCEKLEKEGKMEELSKYKQYYTQCCLDVESALASKSAISQGFDSDKDKYIDLSGITEDDVRHLQVYYDKNGYPHALPAYYKNKLFRNGKEKNIYQLEIQTLLEQAALLHDNQVIQREALADGILIPDEWLTQDPHTWKLPACTLFMVLNNHLIEQRREAQTVAEGRYIKMKNLYNRSKMNIDAPALL